MFDDLNTEQLLNACGHAYDAAYENSLKLLLEIVEELGRRARNV